MCRSTENQRIGRAGETFFQHFVDNVLGWVYRPVHQESDFGIDGYIDVLDNGNITGKSIAVQIKCGNSFTSKKTAGGIRFDGDNKHLNYYLNLEIPVILVVIAGSLGEGYWVVFDIEKTSPKSNGWWIEIPDSNKLDQNTKNIFSKLAGDSKDFSEEVQNLWAMSEAIQNSSLLAFAISKLDIRKGNFETLDLIIQKLTKNQKMAISKRVSAEFFFPEYDSDPREIFEIPEIRRWLFKSITIGFPWFYFLDQDIGISLRCLFLCTCEIEEIEKTEGDNKIYLDYEHALRHTELWFNLNFRNLNSFVKKHNIPDDFNREISLGVQDWYKRWVASGLEMN